MRFLLIAVLFCATARCQVMGMCKPDSPAVSNAGSLAAREIYRWNCFAKNMSTVPVQLSYIGTQMDFPEIHEIDVADVADVLTQKQKKSTPAKIAQIMEYIGLGGGIVAGLAGVPITAKWATVIGAATYSASKAQDYFEKQVPSSANALAGMWGPEDTVVLPPGGTKKWKVWASKMKGAQTLALRPLVMGASGSTLPSPPAVPQLHSSVLNFEIFDRVCMRAVMA